MNTEHKMLEAALQLEGFHVEQLERRGDTWTAILNGCRYEVNPKTLSVKPLKKWLGGFSL